MFEDSRKHIDNCGRTGSGTMLSCKLMCKCWCHQAKNLEDLTPEMFTTGSVFRVGVKWVHKDDGPECPHETYQLDTIDDVQEWASQFMKDPGILSFEIRTHTGSYKNMRTLFSWDRAAMVYRESQLDDMAYKVLAVLKAEFPGHPFDATDLNMMLEQFLLHHGYTEERNA